MPPQARYRIHAGRQLLISTLTINNQQYELFHPWDYILRALLSATGGQADCGVTPYSNTDSGVEGFTPLAGSGLNGLEAILKLTMKGVIRIAVMDMEPPMNWGCRYCEATDPEALPLPGIHLGDSVQPFTEPPSAASSTSASHLQRFVQQPQTVVLQNLPPLSSAGGHSRLRCS